MSSNKSSSDSASGGEDTSPQTSPIAPTLEPKSQNRPPPTSQKRGSVSSSSSSEIPSPRGRDSSSPIHGTSDVICGAKPAKRRRRAPSPSRWVPLSLLSFNLSSEENARSVQVPLPPVRRHLPREERDSWDENCAPRPYHPEGWQGTLPGPGFPPNHGLKGREVNKFNFGQGGGTASAFTVGRVLVF
jgi:hypothetical protein